MSRIDTPRLAILGAGPVGLEAAIYAAHLQLPFRLYERGQVGEHLRQWGHVKMFTPFGMNHTSLGRNAIRHDQPKHTLPGDHDVLTGKDLLSAYLEPLAASSLLAGHIDKDTTVLAIGRRHPRKRDSEPEVQPFRLLLRNAKGEERVEEADVVLDCTGVYGNGRYLGEGGIPAIGELASRQHISCRVEDVLGTKKSYYADRTILVIGAGHSAATTICQLASLAEKHPSTWIIWLARTPGSQPIRRVLNDPLRERDATAARANMLATRGEGHVEFHAQAAIEAIEFYGKDDGFLVQARVGSDSRSWQVDRIIANIGYEADASLFRELQVHMHPTIQGIAAVRHPEPNFYLLGNKSHGRSPTFLLRTGHEQIRDVFGWITGKSGLDLYRPGR